MALLVRYLGSLALLIACLRPGSSSRHSHLVQALLQKWSDEHHLSSPRVPPDGTNPVNVGGNGPNPGNLPRAPHLEDCAEKQMRIDDAEQRLMNGDDPPWADPKAPHPPWLRGSDSDNLAGTRQAQVDLWLHQYPRDPSCKSSRLLLVKWGHRKIGIGASIHLMSRALQIAVAFGRVLVPLNGSFPRAQHDGCGEFGQWGSFSCYWASMTSEGCKARAADVASSKPDLALRKEDVFAPLVPWNVLDPNPDNIRALGAAEKNLAGSEHLVYLEDTGGLTKFWKWWKKQRRDNGKPAIDRWGRPWLNQVQSVEYAPAALRGFRPSNDEVQESQWWSAQSTRFLLRWPSLYLCHLTNRARHDAYGDAVAKGMVSIVEALGAFQPPGTPLDLVPWAEREPYAPRPILSMHIRQGDKAQEMKLNTVKDFFTPAFMKRLKVPDLKHIWLSTEMETVIQEAKSVEGWLIFYTSGVKRQQALGQAMWEAEMMGGVEEHAGMSFANLVISAQCDEFVGTLGSNWSRLIDELRKTNGRLNAGFSSLTGYPE